MLVGIAQEQDCPGGENRQLLVSIRVLVGIAQEQMYPDLTPSAASAFQSVCWSE